MDKKGTANAFFVFQLFFTCLVTILLHPVRVGHYNFNIPILFFGFLVGLALGGFKWMLGKALQKGPPGLTFATVNCASVMPAILIVLVSGTLIDYHLTPFEIIGSIIVACGLFWAGWDKKQNSSTRGWIMLAAGAFLFHVLFLSLWEWRALIVSEQFDTSLFWIPDADIMSNEWFVPSVFAAACGVHLIRFIVKENRAPTQWEAFWGTLGGTFNGVCAFFFMYAAEVASVHESTFIYSVFTVSLIIVCNLWGQWLYNENINWKANSLCLLGLIIAAR